MQKKDKKIKKIVIITGYQCNNNCQFCLNSNKRKLIDKSTKQIMEEMVLARKQGFAYLELIGGEPTIRPDIVDLLKFARQLKFENMVMATNGRLFVYKEFAKSIIQAGLTDLIFSIHGHNAELHDFLTQFKGSFQQMMQGIKNVKALGLKRLSTNTTIVKQNYRYLKKIGQLILRLGFKNSEFIFVDPTYGATHDNFLKLVPKISQVAPYIRQCLDLGKNKADHWVIRYVPLCYFVDYLNQISELQESATFFTQHLAPDFINLDVEGSRKEIARAKTRRCDKCQLYNQCEGIWKEYLKHYGDKELKPVISSLKSDLIIFSSMLDPYLSGAGPEHYFQNIDFRIFQEDLKKTTGRKIKRIVNNLVKKGLNFHIYPLPFCLFNGTYPKFIQNHFFDKRKSSPPIFFEEYGGIRYVRENENLGALIKSNTKLSLKCSFCVLKAQRKCGGVWRLQGPHHQSIPKIHKWIYDKVSLVEEGNLLDCGCGVNPSLLKFYKEISLTNKKVYLLDPDPNALMGLKQAILDYPNIIITKSTAEEMVFKKNMFDVIVLKSVYPHIRYLDKALSNIKRILKKDGLLLIQDDVIGAEYPEKYEHDNPDSYWNHFRRHNLKKAVSELRKHQFIISDKIEEKYHLKTFWYIKAKKSMEIKN